MRKTVSFFLMVIPFICMAQDAVILTLDQCQKLARENYPLIKQKELLGEATALRIRNFNKNWFPQIYINAQATYQSDVTQVSIPIPLIQMPEMNKDMYKISLDVNQVIYDGNQTSWQKNAERASLNADQQNLEVEINKIRERINQIYFSIFLFYENEQLLLNAQNEIKSKLKKAEAAIRNDAMIQNNADVLNAELLKTDQQLIETGAVKEAAVKMLGEFINLEIPLKTIYSYPHIDTNIVGLKNVRPEMLWFDLQMDKLDATKKISTSKILPRVSFFGQIGYGRPGLNMLDPDFNDWYMAGIKITWNVWNWNLSTNERKIIDIQKNIVTTQKETFNKNVNIALEKDLAEIKKYNDLILKDAEIITLRKKIVNTLSVQLDNGLVTATEYTTELNSLTQANLNLQMHKMQRQIAIASYLFNSGQ